MIVPNLAHELFPRTGSDRPDPDDLAGPDLALRLSRR